MGLHEIRLPGLTLRHRAEHQHHLVLDDPLATTAALDALLEGWAR
jgi:hypothetical protein